MVRIRYNKANIFTSGEVRLMPGVNRVDDAKYAAVKDLPGFKNRAERGVIVVLAAKAEASAPASDTDTLLEDIPEMSDVLALRDLAKSSDKEVAKAASIRLEEINAAEKTAKADKADKSSK